MAFASSFSSASCGVGAADVVTRVSEPEVVSDAALASVAVVKSYTTYSLHLQNILKKISRN